MVKNGITTNISTRHQCITVMPTYEKKSLEVKKANINTEKVVLSQWGNTNLQCMKKCFFLHLNTWYVLERKPGMICFLNSSTLVDYSRGPGGYYKFKMFCRGCAINKYRKLHGRAEIVLKYISRVSAARREEKFPISKQLCNVLFII